jgi:hypothetical protein
VMPTFCRRKDGEQNHHTRVTWLAHRRFELRNAPVADEEGALYRADDTPRGRPIRGLTRIQGDPPRQSPQHRTRASCRGHASPCPPPCATSSRGIVPALAAGGHVYPWMYPLGDLNPLPRPHVSRSSPGRTARDHGGGRIWSARRRAIRQSLVGWHTGLRVFRHLGGRIIRRRRQRRAASPRPAPSSRTRGGQGWRRRRQPQMAQDPRDHGRIGEEGQDHHRNRTARARAWLAKQPSLKRRPPSSAISFQSLLGVEGSSSVTAPREARQPSLRTLLGLPLQGAGARGYTRERGAIVVTASRGHGVVAHGVRIGRGDERCQAKSVRRKVRSRAVKSGRSTARRKRRVQGKVSTHWR